MILTLDAARKLVADALERCDTSPASAAAAARALVAAEVDGQVGHGLRRVESYAPQAKVIVLVEKAEQEYVPRLAERFSLHAVLVQPVAEQDMQAALE